MQFQSWTITLLSVETFLCRIYCGLICGKLQSILLDYFKLIPISTIRMNFRPGLEVRIVKREIKGIRYRLLKSIVYLVAVRRQFVNIGIDIDLTWKFVTTQDHRQNK